MNDSERAQVEEMRKKSRKEEQEEESKEESALDSVSFVRYYYESCTEFPR